MLCKCSVCVLVQLSDTGNGYRCHKCKFYALLCCLLLLMLFRLPWPRLVFKRAAPAVSAKAEITVFLQDVFQFKLAVLLVSQHSFCSAVLQAFFVKMLRRFCKQRVSSVSSKQIVSDYNLGHTTGKSVCATFKSKICSLSGSFGTHTGMKVKLCFFFSVYCYSCI